jgi:hypothetical protein
VSVQQGWQRWNQNQRAPAAAVKQVVAVAAAEVDSPPRVGMHLHRHSASEEGEPCCGGGLRYNSGTRWRPPAWGGGGGVGYGWKRRGRRRMT